MTFRALYLLARQALAAAGVESPGADAVSLTEHFFGLARSGLALKGEESPSPEQERAFLDAVNRRASRVPLQYLLGQWEFMGLTLRVGEGVLCPREDTAVMVEVLARRLRSISQENPFGLDLCAGTGAVALGLCSLLPAAQAVCLELSEQAFSYLEQNLAAYPAFHLQARKADVLLPETPGSFSPASLDFLASNPPYIRTGELPLLQPEVQKEPVSALDGGEDGLLFYRAICDLWLSRLKPGGILALEIGEDQGQAVRALLEAHGMREIQIDRDLAGLERCVSAVKL